MTDRVLVRIEYFHLVWQKTQRNQIKNKDRRDPGKPNREVPVFLFAYGSFGVGMRLRLIKLGDGHLSRSCCCCRPDLRRPALAPRRPTAGRASAGRRVGSRRAMIDQSSKWQCVVADGSLLGLIDFLAISLFINWLISESRRGKQ